MAEISRNDPNNRAEPMVMHQYPLEHWQQLLRFVEGEERDPRNLFRLTDDIWDAWPYAQSGRPTEAASYRFRFGHLRSFLKPYVKWYCYQRLIGSGKSVSSYASTFPYYFSQVDSYLLVHEIYTLDELADPSLFTALWESLVKSHDSHQEPRPGKAVVLQSATRAFWEHLRVHFGSPTIIPPNAPHLVRRPVEFSHDDRQIIPLAVIRQLVNRLGLHRDGQEVLNHYDHLRLCVLSLVLCLGRRIDEVLAAPRGNGPDGPLRSYPASGNPPEEALWFQFHPNKHGPKDLVYISPEWKDLMVYCVHTICTYSDEVRSFADLSEQHLFILISWYNGTSGAWATRRRSDRFSKTRQKPIPSKVPSATGLSQKGFAIWLRGNKDPRGREPGILTRWKVTGDGTAGGEIYQLRTHQARHTRQTALAKDPQISLLTRQRDLNHIHRDMQFAYQHTLREQHHSLLEKAKAGLLFGPATNWLADILKIQYHTQPQGEEASSQFHSGVPSLLGERWRTLIARSPHFFQFNRVPCGYCTLPQGPEGCVEYMNCLEATDEGCQWFVTDPENENLLIEIQDRVSSQRQAQKNSLEAGRVVQAQKYEALSRRAEGIQEEVLRRSSLDLRERLKARKQELERDQSWHNE